jgi:hypothetical protein
MLKVVEIKLCVFETIVADGGLVVVLGFSVGVGDAPADYGEFNASASKVGVELPKCVYAGVIKTFGLKIRISGDFRLRNSRQG